MILVFYLFQSFLHITTNARFWKIPKTQVLPEFTSGKLNLHPCLKFHNGFWDKVKFSYNGI